jgi:hypothetical protein
VHLDEICESGELLGFSRSARVEEVLDASAGESLRFGRRTRRPGALVPLGQSGEGVLDHWQLGPRRSIVPSSSPAVLLRRGRMSSTSSSWPASVDIACCICSTPFHARHIGNSKSEEKESSRCGASERVLGSVVQIEPPTEQEIPMLKRTLVPLALAAALAAPTAASAATEWGPALDPVTPTSLAAYDGSTTANVTADQSGGFDWADAGAGAAFAFGLSAAGGAVVLTRRRQPTGRSLA